MLPQHKSKDEGETTSASAPTVDAPKAEVTADAPKAESAETAAPAAPAAPASEPAKADEA